MRGSPSMIACVCVCACTRVHAYTYVRVWEKREKKCLIIGGDAAAAAKSLQLCPTPCDPIDGSPPGSDVPGILQARTLEWVAISFNA